MLTSFDIRVMTFSVPLILPALRQCAAKLLSLDLRASYDSSPSGHTTVGASAAVELPAIRHLHLEDKACSLLKLISIPNVEGLCVDYPSLDVPAVYSTSRGREMPITKRYLFLEFSEGHYS